jgi:hypothetical protein
MKSCEIIEQSVQTEQILNTITIALEQVNKLYKLNKVFTLFLS